MTDPTYAEQIAAVRRLKILRNIESSFSAEEKEALDVVLTDLETRNTPQIANVSDIMQEIFEQTGGPAQALRNTYEAYTANRQRSIDGDATDLAKHWVASIAGMHGGDWYALAQEITRDRQTALERPRDLFVDGEFTAHSGDVLPFKVDCDALSDADIATIAKDIARRHKFGSVVGIPTGGNKLAAALIPHTTEGAPPLIVDDVLTTGRSMEEAKRNGQTSGVVIFARGNYSDWIFPLWVSGEVVAQREKAALERAERLEAVASAARLLIAGGGVWQEDLTKLHVALTALDAADARP